MKLPDWIGRIPQIRAELSSVTTQFIDRRQLERLFGVSASQARRLITRMGPMLHGNSLVVAAEDILRTFSKCCPTLSGIKRCTISDSD